MALISNSMLPISSSSSRFLYSLSSLHVNAWLVTHAQTQSLPIQISLSPSFCWFFFKVGEENICHHLLSFAVVKQNTAKTSQGRLILPVTVHHWGKWEQKPKQGPQDKLQKATHFLAHAQAPLPFLGSPDPPASAWRCPPRPSHIDRQSTQSAIDTP